MPLYNVVVPPRPTVTITPFSIESIGLSMGSPASGAYPASNRAIYIPFRIEIDITVAKLFCLNGATASGNIDMGIYRGNGERVITTDSIAQVGTNVIQEFGIADTKLAPGSYYLAVAMDNTTGTLFRVQTGNLQQLRPTGVAQQAAAFALPSSFTLAAIASNYLPIIGLTTRTVI